MEKNQKIIKSIRRFHDAGINTYLVVSPWIPNAEPDRSFENEYLKNYESAVLHWAEVCEQNGVKIFSPANEPDHVFSTSAVSKWHKQILPKIRELFSGVVIAKMSNPVIVDYQGFDFIGLTMLGERSKDIIRDKIIKAQGLAKRDGVQGGVMVTEFSLPAKGPRPGDYELANYFETVFKTSQGLVSGYFVGIPKWDVRGRPAEETIKKYFSDD
jgi:hypothetical protein